MHTVRCGFDGIPTVRFSDVVNPTVRFGAVFRCRKSYGAVRCCDIAYGAVRRGSPLNVFFYGVAPLRRENRTTPFFSFFLRYE